MRKDQIDGRPTGKKGVFTAEQQAAALGLNKSAPRPAPLPPTPAQARRAMSDKWADDLEPPDFERSIISGDPETVAAVLGARPDDFDAVPLGSAPEGQPIPQPSVRPKVEQKPYEPLAPSPPPAAPDAATKAKLAADFRAHAGRVAEIAESAKASGDATREARAAQEVAASRQVGEALKARGIL